jgi:hypothetical protein
MERASPLTPAKRLSRMKTMFDEDYSILEDDYRFFTSSLAQTQDVPKSQNKAARKSVERTERLNQEQS